MRRALAILAIVLAAAASAAAQTTPPASAATGKLTVTVADPSGGMIPAATVTVIPQDGARPDAARPPVTTSPTGVVTVEGLAPGRYTVVAEFPGFESVTVKDVRVRAGENR